MNFKALKVTGLRFGKLPARTATVTPWDEVCVDCISPWIIETSNGIEFEFNILAYIDPVTNFVEMIHLEGSNPKAKYCGKRFEIAWLSLYPKPNCCATHRPTHYTL